MSFVPSLRTAALATMSSAALVTALLPLQPAVAADSCESATFTADGTCTVPGIAGQQMLVPVTLIGGGAGGATSGGVGGSGAVVTATVTLAAGATVSATIGLGGTSASGPDVGSGGGGSSAIASGSSLIAEAGGGGGTGYKGEFGGNAGGPNGVGLIGSDASAQLCLDTIGWGHGGNADGLGAGGAAGAVTGLCSPEWAGQAGNPASAPTNPGKGGDGTNSLTGAYGGGPQGGAGYSRGGDGGGVALSTETDYSTGGGGGGYGGGGSSLSGNGGSSGGAAGGGSTVIPAYLHGAAGYAPATSGPGVGGADQGMDGTSGKITFGQITAAPVPPPAPDYHQVITIEAGRISGQGAKQKVNLTGTTKRQRVKVYIYRAHTRHGVAKLVAITFSKQHTKDRLLHHSP